MDDTVKNTKNSLTNIETTRQTATPGAICDRREREKETLSK